MLSVAIDYAPVLLYGAYSLGLGIAKPELNAIRVDMEKWWVPIASPGSILEPLVSAENTQQLTFVKAEGNLSQSKQRIVFSHPSKPPHEALLQNSKVVRLEWGEAYLVPDLTGNPELSHVYYAPQNLHITATSLKAVEEIKKIETKRKPKANKGHE